MVMRRMDTKAGFRRTLMGGSGAIAGETAHGYKSVEHA